MTLTRQILLGNAIVILAWPVGIVLGIIASEGVDPTGAGMAQVYALLAVLMFTYPPVAIWFTILRRKHKDQLGKGMRFLSLGPILVCDLIFLPLLGLWIVEMLYGVYVR